MLPKKAHARTATIGLAILSLTVALASCSTGGGNAGEDNVLTVATNGGEAMKQVIGDFEASHPGVTVKVVDNPENYQQITATQLTGGTAADVIQVFPGTGNNVSVSIGGDKGFWADLTGAAWAEELPDAAKDLLTTNDGKLVAVPMTFSSIGGIYNQGALDALGLTPPHTWTEVLQFCADATAAGKVAYGLGLSDTWTTQLIPYALTATLVYADNPDFAEQQEAGTASFSDSAWSTAMDKYLEMDAAGCFNESPNGTPFEQVQEAIRTGDTLATVSVAAVTETIKATGPDDLQLTYTDFPATDSAEDTYLSATTGPSFAVNSKTGKTELAKKFIEFLATPETQVKYATAYGDTAALPGDITQDGAIAAMVTGYVADGMISTWPDQLWPSTTVQPALFDGVQALFSQQDTVEGVLSKMDAAFTQ